MTTDPQKPRRVRWKIGAGILLGGTVIQAVLWRHHAGDRTMQIMSVWYIWPATCFLLLLWWTFLSRVRPRLRLTGLVVLAVAAVSFFCLFRFEGFSGAFVPQYAFRWTPTPEERAARFFNSHTPHLRADGTAPATSSSSPAQPGDLIPSATLEITADDWPQFRGPTRDGIVRGQTIRTDWESNPPKLLWKHPVGIGWSSFAVVGDRAFTLEQRGEEETVVCYDLDTGNQLWVHADLVRFSETLGGDGPRATPTVYDSRLYALGATGILNCLDPATGRILWSHNILDDANAKNLSWGMASSPLAFDDKIVVIPGGRQGRGVIAYDQRSGEIVWAQGNRPAAYVAPRLETLLGVRQILVIGGTGLAGYDPDTGRELWFQEWTNSQHIIAAQPIRINDHTLFISAGYGTGSALVGVTQQNGNVEARSASQGSSFRAELTGWKTTTRFKLKFNGALYQDGYIYGLDEGVLCCFDVSTGDRVWKRGRYGYGQVLLLEEQKLLLVLAESGEVALVEASPQQYREVARFQAIEGKTWNHPVLVRGKLLVRNAGEAACYDLK